ncbi:MAG: hypothetical protein OHK0048_07200 [Rhodoferax sp.]
MLGLQVRRVRPVRIGMRRITSALGKQACAAPLSVGGPQVPTMSRPTPRCTVGASKRSTPTDSEHYPVWQHVRRAAGLCGIDDSLPWGSVGENQTVQGSPLVCRANAATHGLKRRH